MATMKISAAQIDTRELRINSNNVMMSHTDTLTDKIADLEKKLGGPVMLDTVARVDALLQLVSGQHFSNDAIHEARVDAMQRLLAAFRYGSIEQIERTVNDLLNKSKANEDANVPL
jgi:hypothetical protein